MIEHAGEHAQHRAAAAEEARPADDHRGDGVELDADAGIGEARVGAPGEQQARRARREGRTDHVDDHERAVDVDAAHARRLRIAADGVDVPADAGLAEEDPEPDEAHAITTTEADRDADRRRHAEALPACPSQRTSAGSPGSARRRR